MSATREENSAVCENAAAKKDTKKQEHKKEAKSGTPN